MTALALFLLFTVVPAIELYLIIEIGKVIGGWETVLWVVSMGVVGAWLGKRAGFGVLRDIQRTVEAGESPGDQLVEGVLVLAGALLLVTPGILTDVSGALLFVGPLRRWLAPRVKAGVLGWVAKRGLVVGKMSQGPAHPQRQAREARQRQGSKFEHPTA